VHAEYVIAYLAVSNSQTAGTIRTYGKWKAWVDGLGSAMINPGTPLGQGKLVRSDGVSERGPNHLTGFSIVLATHGCALDSSALSLPRYRHDRSRRSDGDALKNVER